MALIPARFISAAANVGNSNGPRIHTYKSEEAHGAVDAPGYFNSVRKHLQVGDLIYYVTVTNLGAANEAVADASFFVVLAVPATGNVILSVETAVTITEAT